jgi:hypothetical protein
MFDRDLRLCASCGERPGKFNPGQYFRSPATARRPPPLDEIVESAPYSRSADD